MVTALSMETYVKVYGGCDCSYIEPVSMNSTSVVPSLSLNKVYYSTGLGLGLITAVQHPCLLLYTAMLYRGGDHREPLCVTLLTFIAP